LLIQVAGWGPITSDKEPNSVLRFLRVVTFSVHIIPEVSGPTQQVAQNVLCLNTTTTLCTWNVMCTTDIGGPLVNPSGLIGVASTTECGGMVRLFLIN